MAIRVPSFRKVFLPHFQKMTDEEFRAFAESNPLRKSFFLKMGRDGFAGDDYHIALDQLSSALGRLDRAVETAPFVCGSVYTIAVVALRRSWFEWKTSTFWILWSPFVTLRPGISECSFDLPSPRPITKAPGFRLYAPVMQPPAFDFLKICSHLKSADPI